MSIEEADGAPRSGVFSTKRLLLGEPREGVLRGEPGGTYV